MHEFAIVQSLLDVALTEGRRAGATRITHLHCRIGDLRQIDDRLLVAAFEALRPGTLCEHAKLHIEKSPARARCPDCRRCFDVRDWDWYCPDCEGAASLLSGGDELELTSIEAEVAE